MSSSLLRDGVSLNLGGDAGPDNFTNHGGLYVPPSVVLTEETSEPESQLATVVEMRPSTISAATDEFSAVADDEETTDNPTPESEPETTTPPALPAPPEDQTLVAPERPTTDSLIDEILIRAFNGVYVLSVIIGLVGQIVGFIPLMGLVAAVIAGGAFELIMVTGSTVGFSRVRNNHGWTEAGFFLTISTFCAAIAAYMNFSHWEGLQATFFGCLTVVGYMLHVISHLWTSIRVRRELQDWEREVAEVEAERKRRDQAARQAYDEWLAEQERQRRAAAEEAERAARAAEEQRRRREKAQQLAGARADLIAEANRIKAKRPRRGTKARKDVALALGVADAAETMSSLRRAIQDAGYELPSSDSTIKTWLREVKDVLAA